MLIVDCIGLSQRKTFYETRRGEKKKTIKYMEKKTKQIINKFSQSYHIIYKTKIKRKNDLFLCLLAYFECRSMHSYQAETIIQNIRLKFIIDNVSKLMKYNQVHGRTPPHKFFRFDCNLLHWKRNIICSIALSTIFREFVHLNKLNTLSLITIIKSFFETK